MHGHLNVKITFLEFSVPAREIKKFQNGITTNYIIKTFTELDEADQTNEDEMGEM